MIVTYHYFLGLRNLTNISATIEEIKKDYPTFSFKKEMDDQKTFRMLASGDVLGVFQLESDGMRKVLMDLKVNSFIDIASALALYRPGPMQMIPQFINRKLGKERVTYPHKDLEEILKETYGTIVYQEQILLIARKFAGYSLGKADVLRRAVSKKKLEVLENERENFVSSSIKNGYTATIASTIYDYIVRFASYGFNKAHAVSYAMVTYQTAFLKCHFPEYYFSALMTSVIGSDTHIRLYYRELLKRKIKTKGILINKSELKFTIQKGEIIFPLSIIRGLGNVKLSEILEERKKGDFISFEDFVRRTTTILNPTLYENIIYSGALDEFGLTKKAMIDNYQSIIDRKNYDFIPGIIQNQYDDEEFSYGYLMEKEKEVIGLNMKYNLFNQFQGLYDKFHLQRINEIKENMYVATLGMIDDIRIIETKQKEKMAFIKLVDDAFAIELVLFPKEFAKHEDLNRGKIVIVKGNTQNRSTLQIVVNEINNI